MSENKFIKHLRGEQTAKSVLELKNQRATTSFANMPEGTSNANEVYSDHRGNATAVLKGTDNWKLNGSSLVVPTDIYGDGRDVTGTYDVAGQTLWVNASYTFPAPKLFTPNTKWVLKLCGNRLLSSTHNAIPLTLLIKFGTTTVATKAFTIKEHAFNFSEELVVDFAESNANNIKVAANSTMTVQVLCGDATATAQIYNGMTVFTALQRRVDADVVASDEKTFDEVVQDIIDINDDIDQIRDDIDNLDDTFVLKTGDTMSGALNIANIASSNAALLTLTHSNTATYKWNIAPRYNSTTLSVYPGSTETNGFRFATTGFVPSSNNARYLGSASLKWKGVYTGVINNGYDIAVPVTNSADTFALESEITDINGKIPAQASTSNQLADKNFVNSSIATNTANFIGTFNSVADLEAYSGTVTNNDYAFVIGTDSAGNTTYNRYKYNATTQQWVYEYTLNNSSFTAEQWASINSGVTSSDVALARSALQPGDLPTVGDGTITINQGGTAKGTFTVNQSGNTTIDLDAGGGSVAGQSIDAEIVGTLTVADNGDVSGFTNNNYLALPGTLVLNNASSFEFVFVFTTGSNVAGGSIMSPVGDGNYIEFTINSSSKYQYLVKHGNNSQSGTGTAPALTANTKYYRKLEFDGTYYNSYMSSDGVNWTSVGLSTANYFPEFIGQYVLGQQDISGNGISILHMAECYIKKNGVIIWQGMDAPGLHQRVAKGHEVIAFQAPTAANNYTWYRKYADGWVEQGGQFTATSVADGSGTAGNNTINLPITMANDRYWYSANAQVGGSGWEYANGVMLNARATTTITLKVVAGTGDVPLYWEVKGMAQG